MSRRRRHRTLIWTAVGVQVAGLIDLLRHAVTYVDKVLKGA